MAALTINERAVRLVRVDESIAPGRSAGALEAGQYVSLNSAGEYEPGGANGGICISTVRTAHAPVSVVKDGILELGNALDGIDYDADVFAAADGTLDDTSGENKVGHVIAGYNESPPKKLLKVQVGAAQAAAV